MIAIILSLYLYYLHKYSAALIYVLFLNGKVQWHCWRIIFRRNGMILWYFTTCSLVYSHALKKSEIRICSIYDERKCVYCIYTSYNESITAHSVHKYAINVSVAVRVKCGIERGHMRRSHLHSQRWKSIHSFFALTQNWQSRAAWTHSYALSFTLLRKSEQEHFYTQSHSQNTRWW